MKLRVATLAVVVALLAVILPASGAAAAEKKARPGVPYTIVLPAGLACPFTVRLKGFDDTEYVVRPDGAVATHGYYDAVITNMATGKHIFRIADGPGVYLPGGRVLRGHGAWLLLLGPRPGHPNPRFLFVDGKFKEGLVQGSLYGVEPGTVVENLCRTLS